MEVITNSIDDDGCYLDPIYYTPIPSDIENIVRIVSDNTVTLFDIKSIYRYCTEKGKMVNPLTRQYIGDENVEKLKNYGIMNKIILEIDSMTKEFEAFTTYGKILEKLCYTKSEYLYKDIHIEGISIHDNDLESEVNSKILKCVIVEYIDNDDRLNKLGKYWLYLSKRLSEHRSNVIYSRISRILNNGMSYNLDFVGDENYITIPGIRGVQGDIGLTGIPGIRGTPGIRSVQDDTVPTVIYGDTDSQYVSSIQSHISSIQQDMQNITRDHITSREMFRMYMDIYNRINVPRILDDDDVPDLVPNDSDLDDTILNRDMNDDDIPPNLIDLSETGNGDEYLPEGSSESSINRQSTIIEYSRRRIFASATELNTDYSGIEWLYHDRDDDTVD